jgi:8-oxo-dGTP diphosphatase
VDIPYQIAVLGYLFDARGRLLLLHRRKEPNRDLYSPVGGKLDRVSGESPTACAVREIAEETGVVVGPAELHLTGIISEQSYEDRCHWLMFLYELTHPVSVTRTQFDEGRLEWHEPEQVMNLAIPATDRYMIWPLFWRYRGRFFTAHASCGGGHLTWRIEQPAADADGNEQVAPLAGT